MYRISISGLVYAPLTADTTSTITYGTVVAVADVMTIGVKPIVAEGKAYGDGKLRDQLSKMNGLEVELEMLRIPQAVRAAWSGNTATSGAMNESATATPPFIALGYKIEQSDGKAEYVWLLKGKVAPPEDSVAQSTDQINYSTNTLKMTFVPRVKDGYIRKWGDENESGFTGGSTFLETVPTS